MLHVHWHVILLELIVVCVTPTSSANGALRSCSPWQHWGLLRSYRTSLLDSITAITSVGLLLCLWIGSFCTAFLFEIFIGIIHLVNFTQCCELMLLFLLILALLRCLQKMRHRQNSAIHDCPVILLNCPFSRFLGLKLYQ